MSQDRPGHTNLALSLSKKGGEYDPFLADIYAAHLAKVDSARHVIVSENIYNSDGLLIVPKGSHITATAARAFANLKLIQPLENNISINGEIDATQLQQDVFAIIQQDEIFNSIHERYDLAAPLRARCLSYESYPLLRQKLTVLAECMPETYSRSLYSAVLSLLIAREMRLPEQDLDAVFLAALAHDIGKLHIDLDIIEKQGELTAEEWGQLQKHVLIGYQILQSIPDMKTAVGLAVLEHHERCDGTGYPSGKVESELSLPGQILALATSVVAVYFHRFKSQTRSWRDAVAVLEMNTQAYFYRNTEILKAILRRSELPLKGVVSGDAMPEFVESFLAKKQKLQQRCELFEKMLMSLGFTHGDRKLHALQNVFFHIATTIDGSGIFQKNSAIPAELQKDPVSDSLNDPLNDEVGEAYLMMEEVTFHLLRLHRMMQIYVTTGNCKNPAIQHTLEAGLKAFEELD